MQARHGQKAAAETGPERTEPRDPDQEGDPAQVIRNVFGDHIVWERTIRTMKGHDGETVYVDEATGQVHEKFPTLNQTDGIPEAPPRKR